MIESREAFGDSKFFAAGQGRGTKQIQEGNIFKCKFFRQSFKQILNELFTVLLCSEGCVFEFWIDNGIQPQLNDRW